MIAGQLEPRARCATTFNVLIPAVEVKPGAGLSVAVYESGEAAGAEPSPLPRFPAEGAIDLAVKAGRMVLDVVARAGDRPGRRAGRHARAAAEAGERPLRRLPGAEGEPQDPRAGDGDRHDHRAGRRPSACCATPAPPTARAPGPGSITTCSWPARTPPSPSPAPPAAAAGSTTIRARAGCRSRWCAGAPLDGNTNTVAHELGHNHGQPHVPACGAGGGGN